MPAIARIKWSALLFAALMGAITTLGLGCSGDSGGSAPTATPTPTPLATPSPVAFVPNTFAFWDNPANYTTSYGPAYADILTQPSNFVPCLGGPFALCYYSGPSPETCVPTADGRFADCQCFSISYGQYFVDINAILNSSIYQQTVAACGSDGSKCTTLNSAPVCGAINQGQLIPGADMISTFSFDCAPFNGLGQTNCGTSLYAGCMTAGCHETGSSASGLIDCQCPTFNGPYQLGVTGQQCTLGGGEVWSAAYAPAAAGVTGSAAAAANSASGGAQMDAGTFPKPSGCVPDAPGGLACPLYVPGQTALPPGSAVDCTKVCLEYNSCVDNQGKQVGYTCDSTLCTRECNDRDLVGQACGGLAQCDVSEIIKAETAAQCSCCASQLCGCGADSLTDVAIAALNQAQTARGITPQCNINGTLCGAVPSASHAP